MRTLIITLVATFLVSWIVDVRTRSNRRFVMAILTQILTSLLVIALVVSVPGFADYRLDIIVVLAAFTHICISLVRLKRKYGLIPSG